MQADPNATIQFRNNVRKYNITSKIPQNIPPQFRNRKHKANPHHPNHQQNIDRCPR